MKTTNQEEFEKDLNFYLSLPSLYHFKIPKDHPLFIKVFAGHEELLNDLDWIYFWANDISEYEKIDEWKENTNIELVKKRIQNKRKSAWFCAIFKYKFKKSRGWNTQTASTAHTFKRFLKSKDAEDILIEIRNKWYELNKNN